MIYLASDHAGFEMKNWLIIAMHKRRIEFEDLGCYSNESCDYPDFGHKLAKKILNDADSQGIAICGTGIGISIALNRHKKIRAARCLSEEDAKLAREHNDANVIVLPGRQMNFEKSIAILDIFLSTPFTEKRHVPRIEKIDQPD